MSNIALLVRAVHVTVVFKQRIRGGGIAEGRFVAIFFCKPLTKKHSDFTCNGIVALRETVTLPLFPKQGFVLDLLYSI